MVGLIVFSLNSEHREFLVDFQIFIKSFTLGWDGHKKWGWKSAGTLLILTLFVRVFYELLEWGGRLCPHLLDSSELESLKEFFFDFLQVNAELAKSRNLRSSGPSFTEK